LANITNLSASDFVFIAEQLAKKKELKLESHLVSLGVHNNKFVINLVQPAL
jgi:hypothetical protein